MNDLYGDESCGSKIVAYAFVLLPEEAVPGAESVLADVKREFGSRPEAELHCSRIFGPTARSKSEWAHLTNNDVYELYTGLFQRLNKLPIRKMAPYGKKDEWPTEIKGAPWRHKDPNFTGPLPWCEGFTMGDKHIAAFCAKTALMEIAKVIDLRTVQLWADPDKTPIPIAGQRRQASGLVGGFFDAPSGLEEIRAMPILEKKPALLQVADAVAFVSRRFFEIEGRSPNNDRLNRLFEVMDVYTPHVKITAG